MRRKSALLIIILAAMLFPGALFPQDTGLRPAAPGTGFPYVDLNVREAQSNKEVVLSVQLLLLLSVLALAPSLLILMTSFLRISIVLDFIRRALSLQQVPPTQILLGLSLFLTVFIMWPTLSDVYNDSLKPFAEGQIGVEEMYKQAQSPLRVFMYKQMQSSPESIRVFMRMRNLPKPNTLADVPTEVLIPAFVLHELTVAFKMGIFLFVPFLIIDIVVASTLMSMGMIMLPPVMISLPFKLILFVLVDGWNLLILQVVQSFR
jgi:flagellar biosynthetic protein FliP